VNPSQHVTIDELVVEVGPGARRTDVVSKLTRTLVASGVERAGDVARAIVDDLDRRGAMGVRP
jgi:hypothetical protein